MSEPMILAAPVELTDAELDAVAGGHPLLTSPVVAGGLVAIGIGVDVNDVLNDNTVTITELIDVNNNQVGVGVAVAALGAAAGNVLGQNSNRGGN